MTDHIFTGELLRAIVDAGIDRFGVEAMHAYIVRAMAFPQQFEGNMHDALKLMLQYVRERMDHNAR